MPTGIYNRDHLIKKGKIVSCERCRKKRYVMPFEFKKAKYCSRKCQLAVALNTGVPWNKGRRGLQAHEKHPMWAGDKVGYGGIHQWLTRNFGKASKCEGCGLDEVPVGKKRCFEWAKLHGKEYERKRENFWMLCKKCHNKYDNINYKIWVIRRQKLAGLS